MTVYAEDQGQEFGLWPDDTSRLIYRDIMPACLNGIDTNGRVYDFGGANGLLKAWIPHALSVDIDESKKPDIVADVRTFQPSGADLIVMRYLLHYLSDAEVTAMLARLAEAKVPRILVVQFVNDDLPGKLRNSVGETKYFRRENQLYPLLARDWAVAHRLRIDYVVDPAFYSNRLRPMKHQRFSAHDEAVVAYELRP